jgi:hypothetical protein
VHHFAKTIFETTLNCPKKIPRDNIKWCFKMTQNCLRDNTKRSQREMWFPKATFILFQTTPHYLPRGFEGWHQMLPWDNSILPQWIYLKSFSRQALLVLKPRSHVPTPWTCKADPNLPWLALSPHHNAHHSSPLTWRGVACHPLPAPFWIQNGHRVPWSTSHLKPMITLYMSLKVAKSFRIFLVMLIQSDPLQEF